MNRPLLPALVAAACALASTPAAADEGPPHTAQITGIVIDARTGAPLPAARVLLQCACLPEQRETTTSARGLYVFRDLPPGTYRIEVASGVAETAKVTTLSESAKSRANFRIDPDDGWPVERLEQSFHARVDAAGEVSFGHTTEGAYQVDGASVSASTFGTVGGVVEPSRASVKERLAEHRRATVQTRDATVNAPQQSAPEHGEAVLPAVEPEDATDTLPDDYARQVVYSGAMDLAVFEVVATRERVEKLVVDAGGFVQVLRGQAMVLRIPDGEFREVVAAIGKLGRVDRQELEALDVTEDYYDLQTRIEVLRRTQAQLLELLDKSRTVEQALAVRRELDAVVLELESLLGRQRMLASQIRYSVLSLSLSERIPRDDVPSTNDPFPWVDEIGVEGTAWR